MRFSELAHYLEKLEKTSSRNELTKILAEVLTRASEVEIDKLCYLLLGELVPSYRGLEFQIAEKMMIQVLAVAYKRSPAQAAARYIAKGDLGDAAYEFALSGGKSEGMPLTVSDVYRKLYSVAEESGEGSQERKVRHLAELLASLDRLSAKYVARIPAGKLRLGFSDATLLDAFSFMVKGDKSARPAIEAAYNVTADIGAIARRVKKRGLAGLARIRARPGIPIRPSLAERLNKIEEVIEKAGPEAGVEEKLDGFRTQVHLWRERGEKQVALFSRNLENTTLMFPEITDAARTLRVKSVILDGETIAYNPKTGKFAPFQETVQRKRKHGISEFAQKIPLSIFVFDVLYLNGKSLLEIPFGKRRKLLERVVPTEHETGAIRLASHKVTSDPKAVAEELAFSVGKGLEGIVVKNLDAPYEAGSRGFHWVKLKATTAALGKLRAAPSAQGSRPAGKRAGLPDTIDCVVMGSYRGRGKRTIFGVGGLLLGVRGPEDRYYSLSRLGTGLSDEQFREARRRIQTLQSRDRPKEYVVEEEAAPDLWAKPGLIAEILADEITLSPRHTAGRKKEGRAPLEVRRQRRLPMRKRIGLLTGRGYSLRFPRLVRFRDDKNPEDATTVGEIIKMYRNQK